MAASDPLPHVVLVGGDGSPSGVPRHMLHLTQAFRDEARVTLISDQNIGGFDDVAATGARHITIKGLQSRLSLSHLRAGWRGLRTYLRGTDADIIWLHARLPVLFGRLMLALRLWKPKVPVMVTFHGLPFGAGHKPWASAFSLRLERWLMRACPPLDLIFLTEPMAQSMTAAMGVDRLTKHRIHVLPNASNLGPLPAREAPAGHHLVMTGRAGWQKNYAGAVKLLAALPDHYSLTLCGAGTEKPEFQQRLTANLPRGLHDRLHFKGPLGDVRSVLAEADAYLLCSKYEGLPIGTLEAFEAGLPIALAPFDGAADLVDKHPYATLLTLQDLQQDARCIDTLLTRFKADGPAAASAIRAVWQDNWSPATFEANSRALLTQITRR